MTANKLLIALIALAALATSACLGGGGSSSSSSSLLGSSLLDDPPDTLRIAVTGDGHTYVGASTYVGVPEPSSFVLLASGLAVLVIMRRRSTRGF